MVNSRIPDEPHARCRFEHSFSRDTDNPTCALLVSRDISARRAQQAAEIKVASAQLAARQQAEMAAFLFHELRNDQHAVAGILELVVNQTDFKENDAEILLDTDTRSLLHQARTHAEHASQVISNMLEFTKLRAGELTLPTDIPFDLHTVCEESHALIRYMVHNRPIELQIMCSTELPRLRGAPFHLKQVLLNLLTNAIKYTDKGFVRVRVDTEQQPPRGARMVKDHDIEMSEKREKSGKSERSKKSERIEKGEKGEKTDCTPRDSRKTSQGPFEMDVLMVRITVEDSGIGIAEDKRLSIFTPFARGCKPGSGLGLPLSRALTELMGGWLQLSNSGPDGGAAFTLNLPFHVDPTSIIETPPVSRRHREERDADAYAPEERYSSSLVSQPTGGLEAAPASAPVPVPVPVPIVAPAPAPALDTVAGPASSPVVAPALTPGLDAPVQIVVADDSSLNRKLLIYTLKRAVPSALFVEASTGDEAFALFEAKQPDMVFLDEYFGSHPMKGSDVSQLIRKLEAQSEWDRPPALIVGVTGNMDTEHERHAQAMGQDLIVGKPFPSNLVSILQNAIQRRIIVTEQELLEEDPNIQS